MVSTSTTRWSSLPCRRRPVFTFGRGVQAARVRGVVFQFWPGVPSPRMHAARLQSRCLRRRRPEQVAYRNAEGATAGTHLVSQWPLPLGEGREIILSTCQQSLIHSGSIFRDLDQLIPDMSMTTHKAMG